MHVEYAGPELDRRLRASMLQQQDGTLYTMPNIPVPMQIPTPKRLAHEFIYTIPCSIFRQSVPEHPIHHIYYSPPLTPSLPTPFRLLNSPNRRNTSEHVTRILIRIRTMMIHVSRDIFVSAMLSVRISARSRKTRQRSLRTWMRGLISRYSRTAW